MSSKTSITNVTAMVSLRSCPSVSAIYALKLPSTRSSAPRRGLANGHYNSFQCGGTVQSNISSENVPAAPSYLHLEADDVRAMQLKHLYRKVPQIFVK